MDVWLKFRFVKRILNLLTGQKRWRGPGAPPMAEGMARGEREHQHQGQRVLGQEDARLGPPHPQRLGGPAQSGQQRNPRGVAHQTELKWKYPHQ